MLWRYLASGVREPPWRISEDRFVLALGGRFYERFGRIRVHLGIYILESRIIDGEAIA